VLKDLIGGGRPEDLIGAALKHVKTRVKGCESEGTANQKERADLKTLHWWGEKDFNSEIIRGEGERF